MGQEFVNTTVQIMNSTVINVETSIQFTQGVRMGVQGCPLKSEKSPLFDTKCTFCHKISKKFAFYYTFCHKVGQK